MRTKILYIAGGARSGSTLIGNILGQIQGFMHIGEAMYIWQRGFLENDLCGCGKHFMQCPEWAMAITEAFGSVKNINSKQMLSIRKKGIKSRHLLTCTENQRQRILYEQMAVYFQALNQLYPAIQKVFNCRVIIDSSKFPSYGYVLSKLFEVDFYVLHLVRDPRAVAYSWWYRRKRAEWKKMSKITPLMTSLYWSEWNLAIRKMWSHHAERYMLLRYEDFAVNPKIAIKNILRLLDENHLKVPFHGDCQVIIEPQHTISGNPNRFKHGLVSIKQDEDWRNKIGFLHKLLVSAITWPWLKHYEYYLKP